MAAKGIYGGRYRRRGRIVTCRIEPCNMNSTEAPAVKRRGGICKFCLDVLFSLLFKNLQWHPDPGEIIYPKDEKPEENKNRKPNDGRDQRRMSKDMTSYG